MTALFVRERTGIGQEVEVSLYNTATWVLGCDISGCLITGEDAVRPQRKNMGNPIRNVYETKDKRWIMLGMTNAQHYWPNFCKTISRPELENAPKYATLEAREQNASHLVKIIEEIFAGKTASEWLEILSATNLIWSLAAGPLEVTKDGQAIENEFFRSSSRAQVDACGSRRPIIGHGDEPPHGLRGRLAWRTSCRVGKT